MRRLALNLEARKKFQAREKKIEIYVGTATTLELILIHAGTFRMGSPEGENARDNDENRHDVTISKPFYMGSLAVTQAQYEAVTNENPSVFRGSDNPVEDVTWNDAVKFCDKLNERIKNAWGIHVRFQLPTEAQWEYACHAETATRFYSGDKDSDLDGVGWFDLNSNNSTHEVRGKKPNKWGLYDMHGNVYQWCQDWYDPKYYSVSPMIDPLGPATGVARVLRGDISIPWIRISLRAFIGLNCADF